MKKVTVSALAVSTILGLAACTYGDNVPGSTVAGAAAGGLLGGAFFHGDSKWAGILGGALLGGIVGNQVGRSMDRRDRLNMQDAIVYTPVGREASWTNRRTGTTYIVTPVKGYRRNGRYCRDFKTRIRMNGEWQPAGYGRACRRPDGTWRIVQ